MQVSYYVMIGVKSALDSLGKRRDGDVSGYIDYICQLLTPVDQAPAVDVSPHWIPCYFKSQLDELDNMRYTHSFP